MLKNTEGKTSWATEGKTKTKYTHLLKSKAGQKAKKKKKIRCAHSLKSTDGRASQRTKRKVSNQDRHTF
jgi:hypothetical protein